MNEYDQEMSQSQITIGPDRDFFLNCHYFLTHLFKHVFCVVKRTISSINLGRGNLQGFVL